MTDLRSHAAQAVAVALGDMTFNILMAFVFFFVVLPHMPKQADENKQAVVSSGDVMVQIFWPGRVSKEILPLLPPDTHLSLGDKVNADIDLWLKSPGDSRPVGYSNKTGESFSLERDDLGTSNDATDQNFEHGFARMVKAGEYIINVHLYKNHDKLVEIPVLMMISMRDPLGNMDIRKDLTRRIILRLEDEEITVIRFEVDTEGHVLESTINDFPKGLRTWQPE